jgi:CheY-like chemotaxis protein
MPSPSHLPVATPTTPAVGSDAPAEGGTVVPRLRVALVDDNLNDIELFIIACDLGGIRTEITSYTNGSDALADLRAQAAAGAVACDVIMLDLNMPGLTGYDVLAALRGDAALRPIPVLVLTTSNAPRDRERCMGLGAAGYLVKPTTIGEFVALLKASLPAPT